MNETESLNFKLLRTDKVALRQLAIVEGEPMSVIVRRIIRDELKRRDMLDDKLLTRRTNVQIGGT